MNDSLASTHLHKDLQNTKDIAAIVPRLIDYAMDQIDAWLKSEDRQARYDYEAVMMAVHAERVRMHCAALAGLIAGLGTPSGRRVLLMSSGIRVLDHDKICETKDAYDDDKLDSLDEGEIREAVEFDTELKDMFGLAWIDDEISEPLRDALQLLHESIEDGVAIKSGTVVRVLKTLLKGHRRGFSRYYTGTDPWPRPSTEIQAEIDAQMPDALRWLRYELKEALEKEAEEKSAQ